MQYRFVEPIRWLDRPGRVAVGEGNGRATTYLQTTAPLHMERMCLGRPVEELPRILPILSPAHHIASAMALDQLFQVEPPPLAANMRSALVHTQFFVHHLRRLYFLFSALDDPFAEYHPRLSGPGAVPHGVLDAMMQCLGLAQEAAAMLGGRAEHPVSAVAGGVGRFLKEPLYERLSEIVAQCGVFAMELAGHFRQACVESGKPLSDLLDLQFRPMAAMALSRDTMTVTVRDGAGGQADSFAPEAIFEKVGLHREPWTYEPFAFFQAVGWKSPEEGAEALFFVGPLARMGCRDATESPRAQEERQRFVDTLGPGPHFTLLAAFWSLVIELIEAAEAMIELCSWEKFTGPAIRTIPAGMGGQGLAVMESPRGTIAHRYQVDARGIVEKIEILDPAAENNALMSALAGTIVEKFGTADVGSRQVKTMIEVALLPF